MSDEPKKPTTSKPEKKEPADDSLLVRVLACLFVPFGWTWFRFQRFIHKVNNPKKAERPEEVIPVEKVPELIWIRYVAYIIHAIMFSLFIGFGFALQDSLGIDRLLGKTGRIGSFTILVLVLLVLTVGTLHAYSHFVRRKLFIETYDNVSPDSGGSGLILLVIILVTFANVFPAAYNLIFPDSPLGS